MMKILPRLLYCSVIIALLLAVLPACSVVPNKPVPPAKELPGELVYSHTVLYPEESLPMIADWYTGDYRNWKTLRSLNCGLPLSRMKLNSNVRIPAGIIRRKDPMSREFVVKKKNAYYLATKKSVPAQPALSKDKPEGTISEVSIADSEEEVLSARDELIDNLVGEAPLAQSELTPVSPPTP